MNIMQSDIIITPTNGSATLEQAGGKGINLISLSFYKYPVPPFFILSTKAYQHFINSNQLGSFIDSRLTALEFSDLSALEETAREIAQRFDDADIPAQVADLILSAYMDLGEPAAAVRSSATTEDLPSYSFAGQQNTYLNVIGEEALLEAVVGCWSSLWTARAIGYRQRVGIGQDGLALAVVVQQMVQSSVSGVMFTADPVSGLRSQTTIEAAYGLGEALVSGKVSPDRFVVDVHSEQIKNRTIGEKELSIESLPGGGTMEYSRDRHKQQTLSNEKIIAIAKLGSQIEDHFGTPQDIEWAVDDGQVFILQTRPITSLYPLPEKIDKKNSQVMFSLASVQGLTGAMTPLGQDAIKTLFAGGGTLFGYKMDHEQQTTILSAGERLWVNVSGLLRTSVGRKVINKAIRLIEPGIHQTLQNLQHDGSLKIKKKMMSPVRVWYLLRVAKIFLGGMIQNWKNPAERSQEIKTETEDSLGAMFSDEPTPTDVYENLRQSAASFYKLYDAFVTIAPVYLPAVAAGLLPLSLLNRIRNQKEQGNNTNSSNNLGWRLTRGLPNNVTTEMDLCLWETAQKIKEDRTSAAIFTKRSAQDLGVLYLKGNLPRAAQQVIEDFMTRYGMRGIGEFDIGNPRWREVPENIIQVLKGYLNIDDESQSPARIFKRGAEEAETALMDHINTIRNRIFGHDKARIIQWLAVRMRTFAGFRESPKFFVIRMMGVIRQRLLRSGQMLAEAGIIDQPDDLFYLHINEIRALSEREDRDWKDLIAQRRQNGFRENQRKQVPRVLVSDGRAFYEQAQTADLGTDNVLIGTPVSPGTVEGLVRVVLDPIKDRINPGEILVCPGTDPAWTPLFLTARGLVMEMGGMMTHGSVVAREYGIPAVVGVKDATKVLKDGQRISVDGYQGTITMI